MNLCLFIELCIRSFCPVPVKSAPMIVSPFSLIPDPWFCVVKPFEKSARSVRLRNYLSKFLEFLTEPSLLFSTALMKQKRRILVKLARHSYWHVLWQAERCASGLAEKVNFCVEQPCENAKLIHGSCWKGIRWSKSSLFELWKTPNSVGEPQGGL